MSSERVSATDIDASINDAVVVSDVSKTYDGKGETVIALKDIDISVENGEFLSVVGPSGCGKTTLLHIASGILEASEGHVEINGVDVQSPEHEKSNVGLVFQQPVLLEWRTVLKNVMLPIQIMIGNGTLDGDKSEYRDRAYELLELVGLEGFEDSYPQELSGGMQQRVSICQSLIYDPDVMFMDEPFGSLDALTKKQLNKEFLEIWRNQKKSVMFVTHDLDEAVYMSDRIIVMSPRPGEIVDIIDVDIPRPRTEEVRTSDKYQEYVAKAMEHFTEEQ